MFSLNINVKVKINLYRSYKKEEDHAELSLHAHTFCKEILLQDEDFCFSSFFSCLWDLICLFLEKKSCFFLRRSSMWVDFVLFENLFAMLFYYHIF